MPEIRSSADLRNHYNEISAFCHEHSEPIFITKNGRGNLGVMSIEAYENIVAPKGQPELLFEHPSQRLRLCFHGG